MNGYHPRILRALSTLGLAATLVLSSCQNLNGYVIGEGFPKVPENAPRTEIELVIEVAPAVWDDLSDHGALESKIVEQVTSLADMGMRFYPVLSGNYNQRDKRPDLLMTVQVSGLAVECDHSIFQRKNEPQRIDSKVKELVVSTTAEVKRRKDSGGPALTVATAVGSGRVMAESQAKVEQLAKAGQPSFGVIKRAEWHGDLKVCESDVLKASSRSVVSALRGLVKGRGS